MPTQSDSGRHAAVAQTFHRIIAAPIVTQFVLAKLAAHLPPPQR
ncbi:MAG TPA: hypothetical protein VND80_02930 [Steroidobacteraceae bacterium]|nr:hypothetical protein [Steroidobacteraceae bacterium]